MHLRCIRRKRIFTHLAETLELSLSFSILRKFGELGVAPGQNFNLFLHDNRVE
jgi:hypothetical protein